MYPQQPHSQLYPDSYRGCTCPDQRRGYRPNDLKSHPHLSLPKSFKNPDEFLPASEALELSEMPRYLNFELQNYILTFPFFSPFA